MIDKLELGNIYRITSKIYAMPVGYNRFEEFAYDPSDLIFKVYSYPEFLDYMVTKYAYYSCAVVVSNGEYHRDVIVEKFRKGELNYYDAYTPVLFGKPLGHVNVTGSYIIKTLMIMSETQRCYIQTKNLLMDSIAESKKSYYLNKRNHIVGSTRELLREYLDNEGVLPYIFVLFDGSEFTIVTQLRDSNYYVMEKGIKNIKELIPFIESMRRNRNSMPEEKDLHENITLSQKYEIFPVSVF